MIVSTSYSRDVRDWGLATAWLLGAGECVAPDASYEVRREELMRPLEACVENLVGAITYAEVEMPGTGRAAAAGLRSLSRVLEHAADRVDEEVAA